MTDVRSDPHSFAKAVADEADRLLELANERKLVLRLTGSLAIRAHSPGSSSLLDVLGRRPYRDITLRGIGNRNLNVAACSRSADTCRTPTSSRRRSSG